MKPFFLIKKAKQIALKSNCNYRISALGLNKKGELINSAFNKHRFMHNGGGIHAEMLLMKKSGPKLKTIIICRVNKSGNLLSISPCEVCATKAKELGIKIITIMELI
jgi:hypothetical protein